MTPTPKMREFLERAVREHFGCTEEKAAQLVQGSCENFPPDAQHTGYRPDVLWRALELATEDGDTGCPACGGTNTFAYRECRDCGPKPEDGEAMNARIAELGAEKEALILDRTEHDACVRRATIALAELASLVVSELPLPATLSRCRNLTKPSPPPTTGKEE